MEPIATSKSNLIYRGNNPGLGDLPCERMRVELGGKHTTGIFSVWELTDEEREAIAQGWNVKVGIIGVEPIPPVSLEVVDEGQIDIADLDAPAE